jgi:GAF domain-containing protein
MKGLKLCVGRPQEKETGRKAAGTDPLIGLSLGLHLLGGHLSFPRAMNAPVPPNEAERLAALQDYQILDTPDEQVFDDLTRIASQICGVPIATISLVDETRQWFKSRVGLEARETPRDVAFCAHTILDTRPLVVNDALEDSRFSESPLVREQPAIRFYAGFPLTTPEGMAVGALCAIDRRPRELTPEQKQAMEALARQVIALMELRRVSARLARALENLKTLHGLLPICAWCKRVREDNGYWDRVEDFISKHTEADFTHGICPECLKDLKTQANRKIKADVG